MNQILLINLDKDIDMVYACIGYCNVPYISTFNDIYTYFCMKQKECNGDYILLLLILEIKDDSDNMVKTLVAFHSLWLQHHYKYH